MTDEILRAWERALLILSEKNPNAAAVYGAGTPTVVPGIDGAPRIALTYALEPDASALARFNADTARRGMLDLTARTAFADAVDELELSARVPRDISIAVYVDEPDDEPAVEPTASELPPHDEAPAAEELDATQRAAAVAYRIAKLTAAMLARHASTHPEDLLALAKDLDVWAASKPHNTATGYPPELERRVALLVARISP